MLKLIADHHNKLDTTELDVLFVFMVLSCIIVGYYVNKLIKKEQDDELK